MPQKDSVVAATPPVHLAYFAEFPKNQMPLRRSVGELPTALDQFLQGSSYHLLYGAVMTNLVERDDMPDTFAPPIGSDIDRLLSAGRGRVLVGITTSASVPLMRLTEPFRQAARRRIAAAAHGINRGAIADISSPEVGRGFYSVPTDDPETVVGRIVELVNTRIPRRRRWSKLGEWLVVARAHAEPGIVWGMQPVRGCAATTRGDR